MNTKLDASSSATSLYLFLDLKICEHLLRLGIGEAARVRVTPEGGIEYEGRLPRGKDFPVK